MHQDAAETANRRLPTVKSAVTNGSKINFGDGRRKHARRFKDCCHLLAAECGRAFGDLAISDQFIVRRLAELATQTEVLETKRAAGAAVDDMAYLAHVNALRRVRGDFAKLKARLTAAPSPARTPAKVTTKRAPAKRHDALDAFSFGENP